MTPEQYTSLHAQIMNLRLPRDVSGQRIGWSPDYKAGHRDARHAAAELANAADAEIDRLRAELAAMRRDAEWRPIDERYLVSSAGMVKDVRGHIMGQWRNSHGYMMVRLSGPRRIERVHRLVAQAFVKNPRGEPYVNHIDCDRANNLASNLEWCSQAENIQHAAALGRMSRDALKGKRSPSAVLTDDQVRQIRAEYASGNSTFASISDKFGVSKRCIGRVIHMEVYGDVR